MIDTVRMGAIVEDVEEKNFDRISVVENLVSGDQNVKYITVGEKEKTVPRMTYYLRDRYLNFEVSLPKMLFGDNVHVLATDDLINQAYGQAVEYVQDRIHKKITDWSHSRIDYCYVWEKGNLVDAYLKAFAGCPVYQYVRSPYVDEGNRSQGFTWRAKSKKVNMYNKDIETGLDLGGLLRCEIQLLNGTAVQTVKRSNKTDEIMTVDIARSEINHWLERCGVANGLTCKTDLVDKLIELYGYEGAGSRLIFAEMYRKHGTQAKKIMSNETYKRRRSEAKKDGWLITSPEEMTLEGLEAI